MTEIQNNLFGIKWPTGIDMPLNKTQTHSSGHDVIHTPAYFLSGFLLWQMVIVISFARGRKTAPPGLRDPSGSKPYQTEW